MNNGNTPFERISKSKDTNGGALVFNTLEDLQRAFPNGTNVPALVKSENAWYTWEAETNTSYLVPIGQSSSISNTAYWKGTPTKIKQTVKLTEIGSAGLPQQWQLWEMANGAFSVLKSDGVFSNTINDREFYNTFTLSTPVTLEAGKDYILVIKYDENGSYYRSTGVDDEFVSIIASAYNSATEPTVGKVVPTTQAFVYKHYLKYEV
jgi:hypothetical protein